MSRLVAGRGRRWAHRRICGWLTTRGDATRCCSPPLNSCGRRLPVGQAQLSRGLRTRVRIACRGTDAWRAKAMPFCVTILPGSRRKSLEIAPSRDADAGLSGTSSAAVRPGDHHLTVGRHLLAQAMRMRVDLLEPDLPTTNANSPRAISTETSSSAGAARGVSLGHVVEADHGGAVGLTARGQAGAPTPGRFEDRSVGPNPGITVFGVCPM